MRTKTLIIIVAMFATIFMSCKKDEGLDPDQLAAEQELLDEYIRENYPDAVPTESGLYYIELEEGDGKQAFERAQISAYYTGWLIEGRQFDSNRANAEPNEFVLHESYVIKGWVEGVAKMKEGGRAILIIPSTLAYEDKQQGIIPPYSTLIFDIDLVNVN